MGTGKTQVLIEPVQTRVLVEPSGTAVVVTAVPIESVWELLLPWQPYERLVVRGG